VTHVATPYDPRLTAAGQRGHLVPLPCDAGNRTTTRAPEASGPEARLPPGNARLSIILPGNGAAVVPLPATMIEKPYDLNAFAGMIAEEMGAAGW